MLLRDMRMLRSTTHVRGPARLSRAVPVRRGGTVIKAVFQADTGAWVVPPRTGPARGVVHFIGGAFAGAAPHIVYPLLLDLLADAGYTVVATPFAITFRHAVCAQALHKQFLDTLTELRDDDAPRVTRTAAAMAGGSSAAAARGSGSGVAAGFGGSSAAASAGVPPPMEVTLVRPPAAVLAPAGVPVFGVGHSNGALMHLLIGAFYPGSTASNVVISFNNKEAAGAIPVPGLLDQIIPQLKAARGAVEGFALPLNLPTAAELLGRAAQALSPVLTLEQQAGLSRSGLALDQVAMVFSEVGDGLTEFVPTAAESRVIIEDGYRTWPTLMVRFVDDTIDETPAMAALLRRQNTAGVTVLTLPGSHVTPCGQEIPWRAGQTFTALDAVVQGVQGVSQADVRRLGRQVVGWLDSIRA